ncbi:MAG: DUF4190 domain-containing protein [Actinoplanes sp.]
MTYPPDPYQPPQPYGAPSTPYGPHYGAQPVPPDALGPAHKGGPGYYGPQPYPGGPGYLPYSPPGVQTNTLAILALIFAFIFPIAGVVLGHLARRQILQTREQGDGLAIAGLWVGYLLIGFGVVVCAFYGVVAAWTIDQATSTTTGVTT